MLDRDATQQVTAAVLDAAKRAGADDAEVIVSSNTAALTRFGQNAVSQNVAERQVRVSLRVMRADREGKVAFNQLGEQHFAAAVRRALAVASVQKPDAERLPLFASGATYRQAPPHDPATLSTPPSARAAAARLAIEAAKPQGFEAAGICSSEGSATAYASSSGVFAYGTRSGAEFVTTIQTETSAGWAIDRRTKFDALDPARVTAVALKKATASQDPTPLPLGVHTVVLEPHAVGELLLFLSYLGFGALRYLEGRSYHAGKLGETFFDEQLTITDNAFDPEAPGLPFDFEGVPRQAITLIERGRAVAVVHDRDTAKRAGGSAQSTGHGLPKPNGYGPMAMNLIVATGDATLDELIASTKSGVLVSKFHYLNVEDPKTLTLTGLTRNGTFRIEGGKLTAPLENMRFTESLLRCFAPGVIAAVGRELANTETFFGGNTFRVPALKLTHFTFTSHTGF